MIFKSQCGRWGMARLLRSKGYNNVQIDKRMGLQVAEIRQLFAQRNPGALYVGQGASLADPDFVIKEALKKMGIGGAS